MLDRNHSTNDGVANSLINPEPHADPPNIRFAQIRTGLDTVPGPGGFVMLDILYAATELNVAIDREPRQYGVEPSWPTASQRQGHVAQS
jgi:hypothetical protein